MKKSIVLFAAALAAVSTVMFACDDGGGEAGPDDIEVRNGQQSIVLTEMFGEPIGRDDFTSLINACNFQDPPLTCALEWTKLNDGTLNYDVSYRCDMTATSSLWLCYWKRFQQHSGQPVPVQFP